MRSCLVVRPKNNLRVAPAYEQQERRQADVENNTKQMESVNYHLNGEEIRRQSKVMGNPCLVISLLSTLDTDARL